MLGDGLGQFIEEVAEQIPDEKTKSDFRQFIKVADHYRLVPPQDGSIKIPTAVSVELIESLQAEKEKREMELGRDLTPLEIAIMIYEVLHARLTYDFAKFARIKKHTDTDPYREGLEVLRDSKGVCGETAYVFTGACRFFGLRSAWVDVPKLTHALSVVILDTGEEVFFDLAYSDYGDNLLRKFAKEGVHRADLHILNDLQTLKDFNSIRPDPLIKIFEDEFVT